MGHNAIGEGGAPGDVIESFLGRPTAFFNVAANQTLSADALGRSLAQKSQAGDVVTLLTSNAAKFTAGNDAASLQKSPFTCTTTASHIYVALKMDTAARVATIHNVWGTNPCFNAKGQSSYQTNGTFVISFDDLKKIFLQAAFSISNASPDTHP